LRNIQTRARRSQEPRQPSDRAVESLPVRYHLMEQETDTRKLG
jgi:hypothetical protein